MKHTPDEIPAELSAPPRAGTERNAPVPEARAGDAPPRPSDATPSREGAAAAVTARAPVAPPVAPDRPTAARIAPVQVEPARPPSLSLPKGGGAVRPIGETFKTNPVTGTGSFSVPLPLPELRGFSPHLSLDYDSGSGNGPFGIGWSLPLGAVSRRTDRRLPEYDDAAESDTFRLTGADDLVPALTSSGVADGYETDTHRVRRYRPRTEDDFSRVERWTHKSTGEEHWVVLSPSNTKSFYGRTPGSRISEDPEGVTRVFSWHLDRIEDDRGNVMEVEYKAEDRTNVDGGDAAEAHRVLLGAPFSNVYPRRIRYAPIAMGDIESSRIDVLFDHGEHDPDSPAPDDAGSWTVRQDPFSRYSAGFEVRTYRLCRRILIFHTFSELGVDPCLTRAVELDYDEDPYATRLREITFAGFVRDGEGYTRTAQPSLELTYSLPSREPAELPFDEGSLSDLDLDSIGRTTQWVDLEGDGLPGLLTRRGQHVAYKANLRGGVFAGGRRLLDEPSTGAATASIVRLDGSHAPTLAVFDGPSPGSYEREDGEWGAFVPFETLANIDFRSPQVRLIDLDGDGRDDLLVVTEDHYVWYPSRGKAGFGPPRRARRQTDDLAGPPVAFFANERAAVFLADMSGDGLPDLVRVTASSVSYWPGLGHGRWGRKVEMRNAPFLGGPRAFDGRRVRLADLDGSGPSDLLYCDGSGIRVYYNQSGNAFSTEPTVVSAFPTAHGLRTLSLMDVFGRGTTQIVWATSVPGASAPKLRAIDVAGEDKPWLLTGISNHMGLETRIAYVPSTKFQREDEANGHPWAAKVPFPVHVVERVETYDAVRKHRRVQTYSYHHGAFDPDERELRGFGRVDTLDADWVSSSEGKGLFPDRPAPENGERPQPPVLTKTWYHLGIPRHDRRLSEAYAREQWSPSAPSPDPNSLSGPVFESDDPLTADETFDAVRALRGRMLRQEIYGLDGTPEDGTPVQVVEARTRVRLVQRPRGGGGATARHGVTFPHDEETLTVTYEKNAADPRIHHSLTLAVDGYGFVTRSAEVALGRLAPSADPEQTTKKIAVSEAAFAHLTGENARLRLGVPLEEKLWELRIDAAPPGGLRFTRDGLDAAFDAADPAAYESTIADGEKKLLAWTKHRYYDSENLPSPLAEGVADPMALPYESSALAFTAGLLSAVYGTDVDSTMLAAAGYVDRGALGFWSTSGRAVFDPAHFYQSVSVVDALGRTTDVEYDTYWLFPTAVIDPLDNTTSLSIDYRVLEPWQSTDPNGNRVRLAFDGMGRVVARAVMGKDGGSDGDTLSDPTVELTYELSRWDDLATPNRVKTRAREEHGSANPRWQTSYAYLDGAGEVAMTKEEAEPASPGGPIRWVGTGRTVLNNKGLVIKQYEPYFSTTSEYEDEDDIVATGVTPLWTYDAVGRNTRVDMPDGTVHRSVFSAWHEEVWDRNDTVSDAGNVWYEARLPAATPAPSAEEQRAATLAWAHRETPTLLHLDNLGRVYETEADNGSGGAIVTRVGLDLTGRTRTVTDPLGRAATALEYALSGLPIQEVSIDSGERRVLHDVLGSPVYVWEDGDLRVRQVLDELSRPTHLWVKEGTGDEWLAARTLYGESYTTPENDNLRGQACMVFDGAGVVRTESFDFKGNPLSWSRTLAATYDAEPDWTAVATEDTPSGALSAAATASLLESETFEKAFEHDALNRLTSMTMPDDSEVRPTYNEASLLEKVDVRVRGESTWTAFVTGITYDARRRRTRIDHGNGTFTEHTYDELSWRLVRVKTTRPSDGKILQDLGYTFDPEGHVVEIQDAAHEDVFFADTQVSATQKFEYDPVYRLVKASGREHAGGIGDAQRDDEDLPLWSLPHPNDAQALRLYEEQYTYDGAGNLLTFFHDAGTGPQTWTRRYRYGAGTGDGSNNRLHSTSLPGDSPTGTYSAAYSHDARGNMTSMPHLAAMDYTHRDQMRHADLDGGGDAYYTYDASGERVRKVVQRTGTTREERIYLGGFELYRKLTGGTPTLVLERETLHVADDARRVAMIETKTVDADVPGTLPIVPRTRYQYENHIGSATLECDEDGLVISYEEYHPFGTAAYRSAASGAEVSEKRYRYTGKERDDETGLSYHSWRYHCPWLGRWTTCDPAGMLDAPSLYVYGRNDPVRHVDPDGWGSIDAGASDAGAPATQPRNEMGDEPKGKIPSAAAPKKDEPPAPGKGKPPASAKGKPPAQVKKPKSKEDRAKEAAKKAEDGAARRDIRRKLQKHSSDAKRRSQESIFDRSFEEYKKGYEERMGERIKEAIRNHPVHSGSLGPGTDLFPQGAQPVERHPDSREPPAKLPKKHEFRKDYKFSLTPTTGLPDPHTPDSLENERVKERERLKEEAKKQRAGQDIRKYLPHVPILNPAPKKPEQLPGPRR